MGSFLHITVGQMVNYRFGLSSAVGSFVTQAAGIIETDIGTSITLKTDSLTRLTP